MSDYHWTPKSQRQFAECLSETGSITEACAAVSMSRRSAYNLRSRADGFGFRIAWDAAVILSRCVIADALVDRALSGVWTETVKDPENGITRRLNYDRSLGLALLSRLDKMFEYQADEGSQHMAAQIASQDFDIFLDLIEAGAGADAIRDFIDTRHDIWSQGHDLRYDSKYDPVAVKADTVTDLAVMEVKSVEAEVADMPQPPIQCELAQNCAPFATAETGFRAFHSLPSANPRPGEKGYHEWIKGQSWARI